MKVYLFWLALHLYILQISFDKLSPIAIIESFQVLVGLPTHFYFFMIFFYLYPFFF